MIKNITKIIHAAFKTMNYRAIHSSLFESEIAQKPETALFFLFLISRAFLSEAEYKGERFKRGEGFTGYVEICKVFGWMTRQKYRRKIAWLIDKKMIKCGTHKRTHKRTHLGTRYSIVNFDKYQPLEKENEPIKEPIKEPLMKYNNINNNISPVSNININPFISSAKKNFSQGENEKIPDLFEDSQKHIQIIGLYARAKQTIFENKDQQKSFIRRNLRAATDLIGYSFVQIGATMEYLKRNADFKWTLETVGKYIDENADILKTKGAVKII